MILLVMGYLCRINAVLLASEDWSSSMIAQVLRLHEATVNNHIKQFVSKRKLKFETVALTV